MDINKSINNLIDKGIKDGLIDEMDKIYAANKIIALLNLNEFKEEKIKEETSIIKSLGEIIDYAVKEKIIGDTQTERDLFDSKVMDTIMRSPSEVNRIFYDLYKNSKKDATDYFYNLSVNTNYIKSDRIKKNIKYTKDTEYGTLEITINLSKPEKDPKEIERAKSLPQSSYPKCLLCKENEGFYGNLNHPSRNNHRLIRLTLNDKEWFLQYSPYTYYNEHCIVLNKEHTPMKISIDTFKNLLEFVEKFPHYFIGSNADLPIVGGSILTHDHYQGGNHVFAMENAKLEKEYKVDGYSNVNIYKLKWPMSVIRLLSDDKENLISLASKILDKWRVYDDESVLLLSRTNGENHNTITPIARYKNKKYELDLVLRNNRTTKEYPLGIFHPHNEVHHIKKENIGLIEVMGLAVLPPRLKDELEMLTNALVEGKQAIEGVHKEFYNKLIKQYGKQDKLQAQKIIKDEVGNVFLKVLENAGVFKRDEDGQLAFDRFINSI